MIVVIFIIGVILLYVLSLMMHAPLIDFGIIWPLFIASFGIDHWYRQKNITKVGMLFVYFGAFYLLMNIGIYGEEAYDYLFISLVLTLAITYLLQNLTYTKKYGYVKDKNLKRKVYFTIFGSKRYILDDQNFGGFVAINLFGGFDFDLTDVKLDSNKVMVSVYSFCGGSSITLPKNVNIVVIPSTLFGNTEIETKAKNNRLKRCIYVKTFSFLCDTDIQNKEISYND